jgi:hypothetical protein
MAGSQGIPDGNSIRLEHHYDVKLSLSPVMMSAESPRGPGEIPPGVLLGEVSEQRPPAY